MLVPGSSSKGETSPLLSGAVQSSSLGNTLSHVKGLKTHKNENKHIATHTYISATMHYYAIMVNKRVVYGTKVQVIHSLRGGFLLVGGRLSFGGMNEIRTIEEAYTCV